MADVSRKGHSDANIFDEGGPTRLSAAAFYCSMEGEVPVVRLLEFKFLARVLLCKAFVKVTFLV